MDDDGLFDEPMLSDTKESHNEKFKKKFGPDMLLSNLIIFWGCSPSEQVKFDTKMITNVIESMRNGYDRKTL